MLLNVKGGNNMKTSKRNLIIIVAIVLAIAVGTCFLGKNFLTKPKMTDNNDSNRVIYANEIVASDVQMEYNSRNYYQYFTVSDMLKEKIDKYKGQNVRFCVIVQYSYSTLVSSYKVSDSIKNRESQIEKELEQLEFSRQKLLEQQQGSPDNTSIVMQLKEIYRQKAKLQTEISELTEKEKKEYYKKAEKRELEFAESIGAKNVSVIPEEFSNTSSTFSSGYFMELTADMITQLAARKNCKLTLGGIRRSEGYDIKISDDLTYYLDKMNDNDKIKVAVVCTLDHKGQYASLQGNAVNSVYNALLNKAWSGKTPFEIKNKSEIDVMVEEYVTEIVSRNNLSDKRILDGSLPQNGLSKQNFDKALKYGSSFWWQDCIVAGFNAELTKAEVIALCEDKEIKVVFPQGVINGVDPQTEQNNLLIAG